MVGCFGVVVGESKDRGEEDAANGESEENWAGWYKGGFVEKEYWNNGIGEEVDDVVHEGAVD